MDLAEVIARASIRDTLATYNHGGDAGDLTTLARCFAPAGVLELIGGENATGPAGVIALLSSVTSSEGKPWRWHEPSQPYIRHHVSNVRITVESPERATSASYFAVLTSQGLDHWGRYRDVLVPVDGRWLFAHRQVRVDHRDEGS
jgi:hypothetical protein